MSRRFDEAIAKADAGLERIEERLRAEPNDAGARETCLHLHGNRGYALRGLRKHQESAKEWTRVVELSTEPVPSKYRMELAIELMYAGEVAPALAQAQFVQPEPSMSAPDCYDLARIYSRSAVNVRNDKSVPNAQRARLAESHIADAMRWLKAAADAGLFRNPASRDQAEKDSDLEILRDRAEFRRLIGSSVANS
jgi:hypothetical protein